jgi:signal transduction histidine kinase
VKAIVLCDYGKKMDSQNKKLVKKPIKGIENIRFLYLVIGAAILVGVIVNFQANAIWLRSFITNLRGDFVNYEYTQANHAAWNMEQEASAEITSIQTLANEIATTGLNSSQSVVFIEDFLKKNNNTRDISLIDLSGQETNHYSRETAYSQKDLQNFANLEQLVKALKGETYVSHINYTENAEPYVIITTPIKSSGEDVPTAILQGKYFLRGMWEIALEMKIGNTGRISVFDDKGMLIADPQPSRVLRKTNVLNLPPVRQIFSGNSWADIASSNNNISNLPGHNFANRTLTADTGVHYLNDKNVEVVGVAVPLNIGGMKWGVLVEQDAAELEAPIQEVSRWLVLFLLGNLGVTVILIWFVFILRKTNSKLIGSQYILEITRDRAEDEKNKSASIIANFVDPVILVNTSWQLALFNPAAEKIFSLTADDIGKKTNTEKGRFSFNDFKKIIKVDYQVKEFEKDERGFPVVEEVIVGKKTEEKKLPDSALTGSFKNELVYKVLTRAVCDGDNVCYGNMKIFYDLTREKMVDRMKSDFISIVAHQLRTPLSAVKWAVGMVMDGDAGKVNIEQTNFLRKGYESNQRMIALVNDMLNVSRIEEGRYGFVFTKISFQEVLNNVIASVEGLLATKHLKISVDKPEKMPELYLDKEKMGLAFQNILDNAIKYTSDYGDIKIALKLIPDFLEVRVKDSGIGIPDADKNRIFSKFFRSANVVKMETEGSGLGLFIVKNIIEKHGGKISLASIEGQGTEVVFTLPLGQAKI